MLMRMSRLWGRTLREAPADADTRSFQLMVRAGLLKRMGTGIYAYGPLLWRVVRKVEAAIRAEMDAIGGQEVNLPLVQPADLWEESGRYESVGSELVRFNDRAGRKMVLAMTHEEAVTDFVRRDTVSYRQLPFMLYQVQTKFRDEPRARGGLIRVREFIMKDAYSFHANTVSLDTYYEQVAEAYERFYRKVGLDVRRVASDVGMMGGAEAHEYQVITDIGEDHLAVCAQCGYSANFDTAEHSLSAITVRTHEAMHEVHTPHCKDVPAVAQFFGKTTAHILKTLAFVAKGQISLVCVRGDTELNMAKVARVLGDEQLRMATEEELLAKGLAPGFLSPLGLSHELRVLIDVVAAAEQSLITGANKPDYHIENVAPSLFVGAEIHNLCLPTAESNCIRCGAALSLTRGIEVGNIFKLGDKYSRSMKATYLDNTGAENYMVMGCYGIGIGRTIACIVEQHSDERGISWPVNVAPYAVHLLGLGSKGEVREVAESLYNELLQAGIEVLYDDREQTPGVKFADADLLGMPLQVVVSKRSLESGCVELRLRKETQVSLVPLNEVVSLVDGYIKGGTLNG